MNVPAIPITMQSNKTVTQHRKLFLAFLITIAMALCSVRAHALTTNDFVCDETYRGRTFDPFVWDGWKGKLNLYQDGTGELLIPETGESISVRHAIAVNPQDDIEGYQGPGFVSGDTATYQNHRLVFWVDFNHTPDDSSDDQRFDGYLATATPGDEDARGTIIGITWWEKLPFAFYSGRKYQIVTDNGSVKIVYEDTCIPW